MGTELYALAYSDLLECSQRCGYYEHFPISFDVDLCSQRLQRHRSRGKSALPIYRKNVRRVDLRDAGKRFWASVYFDTDVVSLTPREAANITTSNC